MEDVHLGETELYNNDELYALLEELEFRTLMNRLLKKRGTVSLGQESGAADAEQRESSVDGYQKLFSSEEETDHGYLEVECSLIETAEQLRTLISEFSNTSRLAIDLDIKGEHQLDLWLKGLAI